MGAYNRPKMILRDDQGSITALCDYERQAVVAAKQEGPGQYTLERPECTFVGGSGTYVPAAPNAPDNFAAIASSSSAVSLSWTDNSTDETGFEIERSFNGTSGWVTLTTTAANVTGYSNTLLAASTQYYYRGRAVNAGGQSAYTAVVSATTDAAGDLEAAILAKYNFLPQDGEGYSILTPSADSRLIYVDPTGGNDGTASSYLLSNLPNVNAWQAPGAVDAYQSVEVAVGQMRQDYPDYLLLKSGEVFTTSNYVRIYSGRSLSERAVVTSYDTGARPSINPTGDFEALRIWNYGNFIAIKSVAVLPTFRDPNHVDFAGWGNTLGGDNNGIQVWTSSSHPVKQGILIEDFHTKYCGSAISCSSDYPDNVLAGQDLIIRRSIIEYSYSEAGHAQGIKGYRYSMLLEDNVLDHNGWLIQSILGDNAREQGQGQSLITTSTVETAAGIISSGITSQRVAPAWESR